jgi:hypothetical protein
MADWTSRKGSHPIILMEAFLSSIIPRNHDGMCLRSLYDKGSSK